MKTGAWVFLSPRHWGGATSVTSIPSPLTATKFTKIVMANQELESSDERTEGGSRVSIWFAGLMFLLAAAAGICLPLLLPDIFALEVKSASSSSSEASA